MCQAPWVDLSAHLSHVCAHRLSHPDLRKALNSPAAASFKHVSPAGAAVALVELSEEEKKVSDVSSAWWRGEMDQYQVNE
jgi:hypothetical protein